MNIIQRIKHASRELIIFAAASLFIGFAFSIYDTTFNNFLNFQYSPTEVQRSFLEFPRELPGVLVVFVSALFSFLCTRRLGVLSIVFSFIGITLIGFTDSPYNLMVVWLFIYSVGIHQFMPVASTLGMEMAKNGKEGARLGQLNGIRNLATILGSFVVLVGFKSLGFTFKVSFGVAAAALLVAIMLLLLLKRDKKPTPKTYFKLRREYRLYYVLNVISGMRKQLFITFAPWVLVKVLEQPTSIMATLFTIGGIVGIIFQPLLGKAIDRLGERVVLSSEAVVLVFVCLGYGFARFTLPAEAAFYVICACFVLDQMLFSVSMARATYIKKIALTPEDVQPALTAAVAIDHVFSILTALLGGLIWNAFGFQYVFLLGVGIALLNLVFALRVKIPQRQANVAIPETVAVED